MVNNTSNLERIAFISNLNPLFQLKNRFLKPMPLGLWIGLPQRFYFPTSRIHTNPKQTPPKTAAAIS